MYTKGPWADYEIWGGDGLNLVARYKPVGSEDNKANARLIAAAPELLEACKKLLPLCERYFSNNSYQTGCIVELREAIAKAGANL